MKRYDVAVVGGGVVGLTAAVLFARAGAHTVLIEPHPDELPPSGPIALRNYAITPGARAVLNAAGAWPLLAMERIGCFDRIEVWDAGSSGALVFDPPLVGLDAMGWIVEHQHLVAALSTALRAHGVKTIAANLVGLIPGDTVQLSLNDGSRFETGLLVGADGQRSFVRDAAGLACESTPYLQRAVVANVFTALPHGRVARQRFMARGPLAFLPLPDPRQSSIVWSTTTEHAAELVAMDDALFRGELGDAFEFRLGPIEHCTARQTFALERARAQDWVKGACVLVGDAAHVVHPLAGQGLNLGLMDVAALIECAGTPRPDTHWPSVSALRRYERWRKSETLAMIAMTDGLKRLYERNELPLRVLRGAGMRLTDALKPVKHWLAGYAMGTRGDLPRLARVHAPPDTEPRSGE